MNLWVHIVPCKLKKSSFHTDPLRSPRRGPDLGPQAMAPETSNETTRGSCASKRRYARSPQQTLLGAIVLAFTFGTSHAQAPCQPGYAGPDGQCSACVAGTYKDINGTASCSLCSAGKFSNDTAGMSNATCTDCPSHTFSRDGSGLLTNCSCNKGYTGPDGQECTACVAGKYKDVNGSSVCSLCSQGTYSTEEAEISDATCTNCPGYTYSAQGSNNITGCICNQGYTGPDGSACTACVTGTYKPVNGSDSCTLCSQASTRMTQQKYQRRRAQTAPPTRILAMEVDC